MRLPLVLFAFTLFFGCTTIDRVNVLTVAVDCDVERGSDQAVAGDADASVLQQQGAVAARFVGSLRSTVRCRDGTEVVAGVEGSAAETDDEGQ